MANPPRDRLDRTGFVLEVEDRFTGTELNRSLWIPHYLPHWSSPEGSAARYELAGGRLRLEIEADQPPWCPEYDGWLRVSSIQTGVFAGPVGSAVGQHRFADGMAVRSAQPDIALYTPTYGLFEARLRAVDDPVNMVAFWMIGYEDEPAHSGEILVAEIFGRDVGPRSAAIGMGVRAHHDPTLTDAFSQGRVELDVRDFHDYAVAWTPERVAFYVDERLINLVEQSPAYPMQFLLGIYEFAGGPGPASPPERYPKVLEVDWFKGWRRG